jgi:hypothetical protein
MRSHALLSRRGALARMTVLLGLLSGTASVRGQEPTQPPPEIAAALPGSRLCGAGRLAFLGLHIYDARLWTENDFSASLFVQQPFALELTYARSLAGKSIAERSLSEMQKLGSVDSGTGARWLADMDRTFPDVRKGDRITGVHRRSEPVAFYLNSQLRGSIEDPAFAPLFFGIWLSPATSEPRLRQALLERAKP